MVGTADKIMRRVRAPGRGRWVCTPKDFLDLGSRAAVDQALSRLVKRGELRRVGRGLYDWPRVSGILGRPAPVDMDAAVDALARRDGVRVMLDGIAAANQLGLTHAVAAKTSYVTDGATRDVRIGNRTVRLKHAAPRVMNWAGRPAAPVAQALRWLGPRAARDPAVVTSLRHRLPDRVKKDLARNRTDLPGWARSLTRAVTAASASAPDRDTSS